MPVLPTDSRELAALAAARSGDVLVPFEAAREGARCAGALLARALPGAGALPDGYHPAALEPGSWAGHYAAVARALSDAAGGPCAGDYVLAGAVPGDGRLRRYRLVGANPDGSTGGRLAASGAPYPGDPVPLDPASIVPLG
jgi:hypothetical protein